MRLVIMKKQKYNASFYLQRLKTLGKENMPKRMKNMSPLLAKKRKPPPKQIGSKKYDMEKKQEKRVSLYSQTAYLAHKTTFRPTTRSSKSKIKK